MENKSKLIQMHSYIFGWTLFSRTNTQSHTKAHKSTIFFHYITKPWSHKGPSDIWGQHTFSAKLNNF